MSLTAADLRELEMLERFVKTGGRPIGEAYHDDPTGYARDVLRQGLWSAQREILNSVANNTLTAVRSGQKIGKTATAACTGTWWVATRPRGIVIYTSAGARQVKTQIWPELRRVVLPNCGTLGLKPKQVPLDPGTGIRWADGRAIYGFTVSEPENLQGFSGAELLFIVDEASGFDDRLYEAIRGNMMGGARLLALGNPTQNAGWFYDAFHSKRHLWSTIHVDSRTTPNCTGLEPAIPGLAAPEEIARMVDEYGGGDVAQAERHPVFAVRVTGGFAAAGDRQLLTYADVDRARERYAAGSDDSPGELNVGIDVAKFGSDSSVIKGVRGTRALPAVVLQGADNVQVAGAALEYVRYWRRSGEEQPLLKVDAIGVGSGVCDVLAHHGLRVVPVDVGRSSDVLNAEGQPKYRRLRDEVWFALRDWVRDGGQLDEDPRLEAEILAPQYDYDDRLRLRVEDKDSIRKRLKRSPDRADALALAVWRQGASTDLAYRPDAASVTTDHRPVADGMLRPERVAGDPWR